MEKQNNCIELGDTIAIAEKYMRKKLMEGKYEDTIQCAQIMIDNINALKNHNLSQSREEISAKIEIAEEYKHVAYVMWENPETSLKRLEMEAAIENEDYETCTRLRDKIQESQLVK